MKKTWMADALFPYLSEFYRSAEELTQSSFFHPMPIYRPFESAAEQNEWMVRGTEPGNQPFVREVRTRSLRSGCIQDTLGGLLLNQSGYLDVNGFMEGVRRYLLSHEQLRMEAFDEEALECTPHAVRYRNLSASAVILCEGTEVRASKVFGWVPITILKGEVLSVQANLPSDVILNRGIYLVPEKERQWKAGATYFYRDVGPGATTEGRAELVTRLQQLLAVPFEVVDHRWGWRPVTPDRRPIIGSHPVRERMVLFNGLGTKGVSLAPYFAGELAAWLENKGSLNNETDIQRYKSLYWKSARHEDGEKDSN